MLNDGKVRLYGRDFELDVLMKALESAKQGSARFVLVEGEGGVGKTQLLDAFFSIVNDAGDCGVLLSDCLGPYEIDPYLPFKELIEQIQRDRHETGMRMMYEPVEIGVGSLALLALGEGRESGQIWGDFSPQLDDDMAASGKSRMFDNVATALHYLEAQKPLILLINNIQWMPPASVSLLQYIFQSMSNKRLLVIGASRTDEQGADAADSILQFYNSLKGAGKAIKVELGTLPKDAVLEMIKAYLSIADVADEALDTIFTTTGGHPLFLHETLNSIKKDPKLWAEIENPSKDALYHLSVSHNISDAILNKFANLGESEKKLLYSAAVIENEFYFDMLYSMVDIDEEKFIDALDTLTERGILIEVPGKDEIYRFKRRIVKDAIYSHISKARKRLLHKRAGGVLESAGRSNPYLLAQHFFQGEDVRQGIGPQHHCW